MEFYKIRMTRPLGPVRIELHEGKEEASGALWACMYEALHANALRDRQIAWTWQYECNAWHGQRQEWTVTGYKIEIYPA